MEENFIPQEDYVNSVQLYFQQINRVPLLSPEEEVECVKLAAAGDKSARKRLIESNLRLVVSIAKHYHSQSLSFMDLVQEGNIGLCKAVEKFDNSHNCRFSTYATWWIRQTIGRALVEYDNTIHIPANLIEYYNRLNKITARISAETGRPATIEEIMAETGWDQKRIETIQNLDMSIISLDTPINEDEVTVGDLVPDDSYNPTYGILQETNKQIIISILDTLTEKEKKIIKMRFGIDCKPLTMEEVGQKFNITRERVRQIENKALRKLRHPARKKLLKEAL